MQGRSESICLLAYEGGAKLPESAVFELRAELVDASGRATAVGDLRVVRMAPDRDGLRRIVVSLTPGDVTPGDYGLKLIYEGPNPGQVREASLPVHVAPQP